MSGQHDLQLTKILDRRRMAVEEPDKYGSTPFLASHLSLETTLPQISELPTAARNSAAFVRSPSTPQSPPLAIPPSVTPKWKLKLDTMKPATTGIWTPETGNQEAGLSATKLNLQMVCQDGISGRFPQPISRRVVRPSADSPMSSPRLQYGKTLQEKLGMKLRLDEMCQEKALPDSPMSNGCCSEQYGKASQIFRINDEKDPAGIWEWNALKAAQNFNFEKACRDSIGGQVLLSPDSPVTERFFIDNGSPEGSPSPSRAFRLSVGSTVPRLSLSGLDEGRDLDCLVAQHQERQVAAGVEVLQAGQPTLSTQLLAAAEAARCWLISFPSLRSAVENATELAAQRSPRVASDVAKATSQRILCELRESRIAVKAFSKPEVLLLEAPASHCPTTPRDALDCIMTALQRGRPSVTVRAMAHAEHVRQGILCAWKVTEQVGRDLFTSRVACTIAQKMEDCAAIADVYKRKNPRILSDEDAAQN